MPHSAARTGWRSTRRTDTEVWDVVMNGQFCTPAADLRSADESKAPDARGAGWPGARLWRLAHLQDRWRIWLLLALLGAHLAIRLSHSNQLPFTADIRHDYSRCYGHALSLVLGRGFADVPTVGSPEAKPIDDFLAMRTQRISPEQLCAYGAATPDAGDDPWVGIYSSLATTRAIDMYVTAALWRTFGVNWASVYAFSVVVSTLTCLLIFRLGATVGGGFWPGFFAATAFCVSPMEKFLSSWSLRDTSPVWFAAGAFWAFATCVDRKASSGRVLVACCATGALVALGSGWRMDPLLLAPYFLCAIPVGVFVAGKRLCAVCSWSGVAS